VRQLQPHVDAVLMHGPPAVGELPEQHVQSQVDPRLLDDCHVRRDMARAPERARHERRHHLGIAGRARGELVVEDRHAARPEHAPPSGPRQRRSHVVPVERVQEVAVAEQLGAEPSGDADPARDQPVEDQQPDALRHVGQLLGRRPLAGGTFPRPGDAVADRGLESLARQAVRQLRVIRQDPAQTTHDAPLRRGSGSGVECAPASRDHPR
jgi:hypothetical protein